MARSYGLVPQTVGNWVKKWRKDHPESVDSEVGAEQSAENRRLRAELREARMEIDFLKKAASFFAQRVPVTARYAFIHREEGSYPITIGVPLPESVSIRLLRLAGPGAIKNRATQERAQRLDRVGLQQLPRHLRVPKGPRRPGPQRR